MVRKMSKKKNSQLNSSRKAGRTGGGSEQAAKRRTILIVDDNRTVRKPLVAWLATKFADHMLIEAEDGESCLKLAAAHRPRLVVMDVRLPGRNGIETARRIRKSWPGTAVVMLSAYGDQAYRNDAANAGVRKYVLKSRVHSDLLPAIREALSLRATPPPGTTEELPKSDE